MIVFEKKTRYFIGVIQRIFAREHIRVEHILLRWKKK